jgi:hypothetical protein
VVVGFITLLDRFVRKDHVDLVFEYYHWRWLMSDPETNWEQFLFWARAFGSLLSGLNLGVTCRGAGSFELSLERYILSRLKLHRFVNARKVRNTLDAIVVLLPDIDASERRGVPLLRLVLPQLRNPR